MALVLEYNMKPWPQPFSSPLAQCNLLDAARRVSDILSLVSTSSAFLQLESSKRNRLRLLILSRSVRVVWTHDFPEEIPCLRVARALFYEQRKLTKIADVVVTSGTKSYRHFRACESRLFSVKLSGVTPATVCKLQNHENMICFF